MGWTEELLLGLRLFIRRGARALVALGALQTSLGDEPKPPGPLPPAAERATFQLADDELTVELVAAEPAVASPVAMCWDERYALYVAEMNDYPLGPTAGRIRRLLDRDGDGHYEQSTIFADGMNFPNGLLFSRGGLLVTAAPDLWLLEDTDDDGVADRRQVVYTGFGTGNQQLRANGLTWGIDGWIYGANGRSDGEIRRAGGAAYESSAQPISIRTRDFRFRPDFGQLDAVWGQSQFGQTCGDNGDRFLSWNTVPLRHALFDEREATRWPRLATRAIHNPAPPDDPGEVFPRAPQPQTFNRESTAHYNALCGLTIYRGDALGPAYRGNAFVGESLSNLIHRRTLSPQGPTYVARRGETGNEFLAAADPWFHPVFLTTGPDGCLYVADFYRRWVEHPQFVPEAWRNQVTWQEGAQYGRIWRIRRRDAAAGGRPLDAWRDGGERPAELVAMLGQQADGWHADAIQRLLLERTDKPAVAALEELVLSGVNEAPDEDENVAPPAALARARALWTLEAAGRLDEPTLLRALHDLSPAVREHAVRIAGGRVADSVLIQETLAALTDDREPRVRFQLARAWAAAPRDVKTIPLSELAGGNDPGGWIGLAVCASAGDAAAPILERRMKQGQQRDPTSRETTLLFDLATALADRNEPVEWIPVVAPLASAIAEPSELELATLAGLGVGLADRGRTIRESLIEHARHDLADRLAVRLNAAIERGRLAQGPPKLRLRLVQALATAGDAHAAPALAALVDGREPSELADSALRALAPRGGALAAEALLEKWPTLPAALRRQVAGAAVNWPPLASRMADALERGLISPLEFDLAQRQALGQHADAPLAQRFSTLFAAAAPTPRDAALADYQQALNLPGDRRRGAALLHQHCLTCHTMFGLGRQVGPDLTGAGHKPKEALLVDLLDPSRQVSPDFLAYTLTTRSGRALTGLLTAESAAGVMLRRGEGADDFVPRDDVEELSAGGKSLMPEGFEQKLTRQDAADLLEFLRLPERALLDAAEQPR